MVREASARFSSGRFIFTDSSTAEFLLRVEVRSADRPICKPRPGLADVLARINDHNIQRLNQLLPWNWKALST
jgi:hypothetical protein